MKLPKGIYARVTKAGLTYYVSFMMDGARISLGTFHTAELAMQAMMKFKQEEFNKLLSSGVSYKEREQIVESQLVEAAAVAVPMQQTVDYDSILASVPPAMLSFDNGIVIDDVAIPKSVVVAYLNKMYDI